MGEKGDMERLLHEKFVLLKIPSPQHLTSIREKFISPILWLIFMNASCGCLFCLTVFQPLHEYTYIWCIWPGESLGLFLWFCLVGSAGTVIPEGCAKGGMCGVFEFGKLHQAILCESDQMKEACTTAALCLVYFRKLVVLITNSTNGLK